MESTKWMTTLKKSLLALAILVMTSFSTASASSWSTEEKAILLAASVMHTIDWRQTQYIVKNPDRFRELNPLLPDHPTMSQVNRHFLIGGLVIYLLADQFPTMRSTILMTYISLQVVNTVRNYHVGLRLDF